jgi:hypothetical protein
MDVLRRLFYIAHHCVANHPANRIMQEFYHPRSRRGLEVPAIIGLTASPVIKSTPDQLQQVLISPEDINCDLTNFSHVSG